MTTQQLPAALLEMTDTYSNGFWYTITEVLPIIIEQEIEKGLNPENIIPVTTVITIDAIAASLATVVSTWASAMSHGDKYATTNMTSVLVNEAMVKATELNERLDGK